MNSKEPTHEELNVLLEKNGTLEHHLQSMESTIARSIKFTKKEITDWCNSRDWKNANLKDRDDAVRLLSDTLPAFALDENTIRNMAARQRVAEIIADVCDFEMDPVGEYLWARLMQEPAEDDLLPML
jgi:hypothetical protein